MIPKHLLERAKWLEIRTKILTEETRISMQRSLFRGQGLEFSEHRTYVAGDDARAIDWKVSARLKEPVVKLFEEERERTILIFLDLSESMEFGSRGQFKSQLASEVAFVIAAAATFGGDRFTLCLYKNNALYRLPIRKGMPHLRRIGELLFSSGTMLDNSGKKYASVSEAIPELLKFFPKRSELFFLSDFYGSDWVAPFQQLSFKHSIMPIIVEDRLEKSLQYWPKSLIRLESLFGEASQLVDVSSYAFQKYFSDSLKQKKAVREGAFLKKGFKPLYLTTGQDFWRGLSHFLLTGIGLPEEV